MSIKSRAAIIADITSLLADNVSGLITPAKVRQIASDIADSCYNPTTDGAAGGVDASIDSWAALQAVATVGVAVPAIKQFVDAATFVLVTAVLKAGTDATDSASGVYRPADYNASTNAKVWFQAGH